MSVEQSCSNYKVAIQLKKYNPMLWKHAKMQPIQIPVEAYIPHSICYQGRKSIMVKLE